MAIWVVIFHGLGFVNFKSENVYFDFINNGFLPVVAFIILSGFVTHILLEKGETFKVYITRRFFRLFPIYLLCLIISILTLSINKKILLDLPYGSEKILNRIDLINQAESFFSLNVFSHLTLSHGLFPNHQFPFTYTLMGQSWSLTLEWQFYLFIPILYGVIYNENRSLSAIMLILIFILLIPFSNIYMPQKSFLPYMIQYFLIGFFSYNIFCKIIKDSKVQYYLILLITPLFFIFWDINIAIIIAAWSLILILQGKGIFRSFFENKHLLYLGKISYSLYCVHMIVYYLVIYFLQLIKVDLINYSYIIILLGLPLSLIVSNLTYEYVEKKFISIGKRVI